MENYSAFSYKAGRSFVHRLPSWIKILFIPLFNIVIFSLDMKVSIFFIILQFILFFFLKFSVREQLTDLTPVIWYGVFMYAVSAASEIYIGCTLSGGGDYKGAVINGIVKAFSDKNTHAFILKFFACCQSASLMFKTSTSLELKEGIELIEIKIRSFLPCKKEPSFAVVVSMFINFIPAVFKIWNQLKRSWYAREGRNSLFMYLALIPVLFSVGLKYASDAARAVMNRSI